MSAVNGLSGAGNRYRFPFFHNRRVLNPYATPPRKVGEERMPGGKVKRILKDKTTGEILQKIQEM